MIDVDEFIAIRDGSPNLEAFLKPYKKHGGLSIVWQIFGSDGREQRPAGVLGYYNQ